jgi:nitroreductase
MELYEVMRTTFAAREFTAEPVPDAVLVRILENARFAPSGGNRQGWKVIVIREQATRDALLPLIMPVFQRYTAQVQAGEAPWNTINETRLTAEDIAATRAPEGFIRQVLAAPVLLMVVVDLAVVASFDRHLDRVGVISGASVYPFVWNILLAARNEGLGGTLTTFVSAAEREVQQLLGLPEHVAVAALVPLGKPVKQLTRLRRKPVTDIAVLERWEGAPLTGA